MTDLVFYIITLSEAARELTPQLIDYVDRNSHVTGVLWDPRLKPRLPIDPFSRNHEDMIKTAHFFLLAASINETRARTKLITLKEKTSFEVALND